MRLLREEVAWRPDAGLRLPRAAGHQRVGAPHAHLRHHAAANHRRGEWVPGILKLELNRNLS